MQRILYLICCYGLISKLIVFFVLLTRKNFSAASKAIHEGKILKNACTVFLGMKIELFIAFDSCNLFTSLSTLRDSVDKSIQADVNCINYEYEVGHSDEIIWIPEKVNLTDPSTKTGQSANAIIDTHHALRTHIH